MRQAIKLMAQGDHKPDWQISLNATDYVELANRRTILRKTPEPQDFPVVDPETYDDAYIVTPGYATYYLERE